MSFSAYVISNIFVGSQYSLLNGLRQKRIITLTTLMNAIFNPLLSIYLCKLIYVNGPIVASVAINLLVGLILSNYIKRNKVLNYN